MEPRLPFVRSVLVVASAAVLALAAYVFVCLQMVQEYGSGSHAGGGSVDAVVVMGAAQYDGRPSPMLEARLQSALENWRAGRTKWIAVTGGKQQGDRYTEAGASTKWLVANSVPASAVLGEETGRSTWESLDALAPVLRQNGVRSVRVITTDWHVARAVMTLREFGFSVVGEPAGAEGHTSYGSRWWREAVGVAIGRLIGFDRLYRITG